MSRLDRRIVARALVSARHPRSKWTHHGWSDGWDVDQSGDDVVVWWAASGCSFDPNVEPQRLAAYAATLERAGWRVETVPMMTLDGPGGRSKLIVSVEGS